MELAATISERLQDKGMVEAINVDNIVLPNAPAGNREAALKVRKLYFGIHFVKPVALATILCKT